MARLDRGPLAISFDDGVAKGDVLSVELPPLLDARVETFQLGLRDRDVQWISQLRSIPRYRSFKDRSAIGPARRSAPDVCDIVKLHLFFLSAPPSILPGATPRAK